MRLPSGSRKRSVRPGKVATPSARSAAAKRSRSSTTRPRWRSPPIEPGSIGGERHLGLVVDDRERFAAALRAEGVATLPGRTLRFRDPDGNLIEIVDYRNVQFAKTAGVLVAMGLGPL